VVLGVVALVACGGGAWLALVASRALARAGEARAREAAAAEALTRQGDELRTLRDRLDQAQRAVASLEATIEGVRAAHEQELRGVRDTAAERLAAAEQHRKQLELHVAQRDAKLQESFGSLAAQVLERSQQQLLAIAEQKLTAKTTQAAADADKQRLAVEGLVKPIAEVLAKAERTLAEMEKDRTTTYAELRTRVDELGRAGGELRSETAKLVKALREPQVRGRYGEVQLRRIVEVAGLRSYCDFVEQEHTAHTDGRAIRPDMIVRLPGGRELIVDAKANLKPYLDAIEAPTPEEAERHLDRFADGVVDQAERLGRKGYFEQYGGTPDFVFMFVPGDQLVDAALARRPDLLEAAARQNVILVSPSSLIGALRAVAVCLREERLAQSAQALQDLGRELHKRAADALEHVEKLGDHLRKSVESFNRFIGSYDRNLAPTLRKFEDAGLKGAKELPEPPLIEALPRDVPAPDDR
jgi:DNA recombination protein RmuC